MLFVMVGQKNCAAKSQLELKLASTVGDNNNNNKGFEHMLTISYRLPDEFLADAELVGDLLLHLHAHKSGARWDSSQDTERAD